MLHLRIAARVLFRIFIALAYGLLPPNDGLPGTNDSLVGANDGLAAANDHMPYAGCGEATVCVDPSGDRFPPVYEMHRRMRLTLANERA